MKILLQIEEVFLFSIGIIFFTTLGYSWWIFWGLLLVPDVGLFGYLINTQTGTISYNIFHHRGIAIAVGLIGFYWSIPLLILAGTILFTHVAMDRILGYGLKYSDSFTHTHLGTIGRKAEQ